MENEKERHKKLNSFQIIVLGFLSVVLIGACLLTLPISSQNREWTSFIDALFTAVTSSCVTGLVVVDTGTYWSGFGQAIILLLIQIGGLGVITMAVSFTMLAGRKISLIQRSTMQDAVSAPNMSGIVRLTRFVLKGTFLIEGIGALIMMPVFCSDFGAKGIWMAIFHSISAFCNAGLDLLGVKSPYSSLTSYASNPVITLTIMALIVVGGIGFLTWDDIRTHKFNISRYRMQTKVILLVTTILIFLPATYFFFAEYSSLPLGERILTSLFQSITTRTAGFNTADTTQLSGVSKVITAAMMMIGAAPGSTAGGIKVTTMAVLFANAFSVFRKSKETHLFRRRVGDDIVRSASTILLMYITLFLTAGCCISGIEGLPIGDCLFETASAIGTVGLTMGITPTLGWLSKIILITLMFFGRVGGLTLIYATQQKAGQVYSKLPQEKITVG